MALNQLTVKENPKVSHSGPSQRQLQTPTHRENEESVRSSLSLLVYAADEHITSFIFWFYK